MNERRDEIRRENKKALKKFILIIVIAAAFGGAAGLLGTIFRENIIYIHGIYQAVILKERIC